MDQIYTRLKNMAKDDFVKLTESAAEYERVYRGCSQATVGAFIETLGLDPYLYQVASGFAGGIGLTTESECGGFTGGVIIISALFGRGFDERENIEKSRHCHTIIRKYRQRFQEEFGSTLCPQVQTKIFGRSYRITDPEEFKAFEEAGAHADKCPGTVARAARLIAEVIMEEYESR